ITVGGRAQLFAVAAVDHIEEAVAAWAEEDRAPAVTPGDVGENDLVNVVVVVKVVRAALIEPDCLAGIDVARKNARRPFVVAWTLVRIPRTGIRRAVEDQLRLGIIADPAPCGRSADLPSVRRPAADPEVLAA